MKIVRCITAAATVVLITLGTVVFGPMAPASAAVLPAYLQNSEAGLCMDDYALSGNAYQYPCNAQDNQWWDWTNPLGGNSWQLRLGAGRYQGLPQCLYPENAAYYARIKLLGCNAFNPRQRWAEHKINNFSYYESLWAPGKCIGALVGPSISELVLAECVVRPSILWKKVTIDNGPPPAGPVWG